MAIQALDGFIRQFSGRVLVPGGPDYDNARSVWNGAIDRKPAVIARCTQAGQVADALRFAREAGLPVAVRGGGHSYAGHAVCDDGMMIHLGDMKAVSVDPISRRATCGGGATWEDLDTATQAHGLATTGGFISHTGVGGLTLGGGIGWLTKKAGLTCDNLTAAEVVTADGQIVRASSDDNADLLWALKGGGGNFGIVTSFEYELHAAGPLVQLGLFFAGLDEGARMLRFSRDYLETLPTEITGFLGLALSAPPEPFVPEEHRFKPGYALLVVGFGSPEEHARAIAPIRDGFSRLFELVTPIPYLALQKMFNGSAEWGCLAYEKAIYLDALSDDVIETICEHSPRKKSPLSFVPTFHMAGAYRSHGDTDTAFGGSRSARYVVNVAAHAPPNAPELYEADRAWSRSFWDALRPHASSSGGYVNFLTEVDEDRVRASYGARKYERLAALKRKWDPENIFRLNANILPA